MEENLREKEKAKVTNTVEFGGGHMAAWAYIKSSDRNKLVNVDRNLNRENYISFLQSDLRAGSEHAVSFLNDTAPC